MKTKNITKYEALDIYIYKCSLLTLTTELAFLFIIAGNTRSLKRFFVSLLL